MKALRESLAHLTAVTAPAGVQAVLASVPALHLAPTAAQAAAVVPPADSLGQEAALSACASHVYLAAQLGAAAHVQSDSFEPENLKSLVNLAHVNILSVPVVHPPTLRAWWHQEHPRAAPAALLAPEVKTYISATTTSKSSTTSRSNLQSNHNRWESIIDLDDHSLTAERSHLSEF